MERIVAMTAGSVLSVNPNTMYPLLRQLEGRGLIEGSWEHPERRSRRYYSLTDDGRAEYARLVEEVRRLPRLGQVVDRRDRPPGLRLVGTAYARGTVPLQPEDALALWTNVDRWPTFIEGFARVIELSQGWPDEGGASELGVDPGRPRPGREGRRAAARQLLDDGVRVRADGPPDAEGVPRTPLEPRSS